MEQLKELPELQKKKIEGIFYTTEGFEKAYIHNKSNTVILFTSVYIFVVNYMGFCDEVFVEKVHKETFQVLKDLEDNNIGRYL
ncbi:hypothetical protein [Salibacterium halotolerans]|nr:hypothetical protein [Salibacterium halotolerans]